MSSERRNIVKKAFQMYLTHKTQLCLWEQELRELPIPGYSGVDYSHESVSNGTGNSVEVQFAMYADKVAELEKRVEDVKKKVELVRRTIEHFRVESKAKGKRHYDYICARWLRRMNYYRAAIECNLPERTADFIIEEIFTVAEAIGEEYELF